MTDDEFLSATNPLNMPISHFSYFDLERTRSEYKAKMRMRDGFSPEQQIAMATLHNQQAAGGSPKAVLVILSKPTLKALWNKGVINPDGRLTKNGDELLKSRWKGDRFEKRFTVERQ